MSPHLRYGDECNRNTGKKISELRIAFFLFAKNDTKRLWERVTRSVFGVRVTRSPKRLRPGLKSSRSYLIPREWFIEISARTGTAFVIVILIVIVLEKPVLGFDYDYEYDYEYEKYRLGFIASQVDKNIRITPGAKNLL